ncbi:MAG TPA: ABC transporter ATP-binding protein [Spongiibacteraceae bacterium]|nr:ABC transporter ATP-binding protein [Spongiibacteraceae bacterium]
MATLLCARSVRVAIESRMLLDGVDAELRAGEMVGLIGPNGAGKTTLLRVLAKLLEPDDGSVTLDQIPLAQIPPAAFARRCAYLAQGAQAYWPLTVERVVALGRLPHLDWRQTLRAEDGTAIECAMVAAEVEHLRERTVTTLSGGERMRVLLARIFASQPQIILTDEPIAALDPYHQLHVMELLREHAHAQRQPRAVLAVLHDLNLAARFCDRLILVAHGHVVCEGAPREVLTAENLRSVYGVNARIDGDFSVTLTGRAR